MGSVSGHLVRRHTNPCHGIAVMGTAPDDCILAVGLCQAVGMVDVGCPVASPLIKGAEGCRLNRPVCCQHVSFVRCSYYIPSTQRTASTCERVYPLSQGSVTSQHQCDDVTLARLVGILDSRTFEPPHLECACQRIDLQSPHATGDAWGDGGDADHVCLSLFLL